jgi:YidC/Oxa1 family membrane protein insertase
MTKNKKRQTAHCALPILTIFISVLACYPAISTASLTVVSEQLAGQFSADGPGNVTAKTDQLTVIARSEQVSPGLMTTTLSLGNSSTELVELSPLTLSIGIDMAPFDDPGGGYGSDIYAYLNAFVIDQTELVAAKEGTKVGPGDWFGWKNRYSIEAVRPRSDWTVSLGQADLTPSSLTLNHEFADGLLPGQSVEISFDYVMGPRDKKFLSRTEIGLGTTILPDLWWWFRWLCLGIWALLDVFKGIIGDWGAALILLALVIRLATYPITKTSLAYQERANAQQRRIAPKEAAIKQNFRGVELSKKMIELYEDERYDTWAPFKGMLGLFIQIPILIGLFTVIGELGDLRNASFLWIDDLSVSDRLFSLGVNLPFFGNYFNVLPILMALVTVISTWQATRNSEKTGTAVSLFGMALLFFVFFYSFPAGLVLYWFSSNFFQLIQQSLGNYLNSKSLPGSSA